jgi:hypothetical protein
LGRDEIDHENASVAFVLKWELSHLGDDEYDARLLKFPGWENTMRLSSTKEYNLPQPIRFDANFRTLARVDYPYNNVRWPIMSSRMIQTLEAVGEFSHKAIEIVMLDDTILPPDRYDQSGKPRNPKLENRDFRALQLLNHLDAFDWEKSVAERDEDLPARAQSIDKLVLKEPAGGFPPLFRLSVYPVALFVSSAARTALEKAGIGGVDLQELKDFKG